MCWKLVRLSYFWQNNSALPPTQSLATPQLWAEDSHKPIKRTRVICGQKEQKASREVGAPGRAQEERNIDAGGLGCRRVKGDRKIFFHTQWISSSLAAGALAALLGLHPRAPPLLPPSTHLSLKTQLLVTRPRE